MRLDGHDDLLEGAVAGSLAEAVDGALNLPGAVPDARERVGGGKAKVVVAVRREAGFLEAGNVLLEVLEVGRELFWRGVAHGVRDVDGGGAFFYSGLHDFGQESLVGAGGVLRAELDVLAERIGVGHHFLDLLQSLGFGYLKLVLEVDVAGGEENVDAWLAGVFDGFVSGVDVLREASGQARDFHVACYYAGDRFDGLEVLFGSDWEAGFDDVHVQELKLFGDSQLLRQRHGGAGALFAVP